MSKSRLFFPYPPPGAILQTRYHRPEIVIISQHTHSLAANYSAVPVVPVDLEHVLTGRVTPHVVY